MFPKDTEIVSIANFGQGDSNSKIWLANLFCFGREVNLFDCSRGDIIGINSCSHDEDAAIRCFGISIIIPIKLIIISASLIY